jgi:hypothetical protein
MANALTPEQALALVAELRAARVDRALALKAASALEAMAEEIGRKDDQNRRFAEAIKHLLANPATFGDAITDEDRAWLKSAPDHLVQTLNEARDLTAGGDRGDG